MLAQDAQLATQNLGSMAQGVVHFLSAAEASR
jgi:hypothetical protein